MHGEHFAPTQGISQHQFYTAQPAVQSVRCPVFAECVADFPVHETVTTMVGV